MLFYSGCPIMVNRIHIYCPLNIPRPAFSSPFHFQVSTEEKPKRNTFCIIAVGRKQRHGPLCAFLLIPQLSAIVTCDL